MVDRRVFLEIFVAIDPAMGAFTESSLPLVVDLECFMASPHLVYLLLVLTLHLSHTLLHLLHLIMLYRHHLLILRKLTLRWSLALFDILTIALLSFCHGLVRLVRLVPLLSCIVHVRVLVATVTIELGLHHILLWRVVHEGIWLLLLHLLILVVILLAFDYKLEHFELVLLHASHVLHLLLVDPLSLH